MNLESAGIGGSHNIFSIFNNSTPLGCPTHGLSACECHDQSLSTSDIVLDDSNTYDASNIIVSTWTCASCGYVVAMGQYHICGAPQTTPIQWNPGSFTLPMPECALCDKPLVFGDKKVCADCRGVFEAWKFLTKKDESEPE